MPAARLRSRGKNERNNKYADESANKELQDLERYWPCQIAPLTVLFGTNSSGKSSIEQFFLMLKQTMESSDRKTVIYPGDQNSPVNLGSFEELLFARDSRNQLEFNFEWSLPGALTVRDPRSDFTCSGDHLRFSADIGMAGEKHQKLAVSRLEYQLKQDNTEQMRVWIRT